jgi:glycosyltransferase involved in cell wall biosynthesis
VVREMNILYYDGLKVASFFTASIHIYEVLNGLSRLGHNVVALDLGSPGDILEAHTNWQSSPWERLKNSVVRSRTLRPIIGEISILWSFLHEIYLFISAFIIIARYKGRFDIIYRRHYLFDSGYLLAKLLKIRFVKEVNSIAVDEVKIHKREDRISLWVTDRIERFSMPKADKIIVVTSRLKEILQKDYGVPGSKIIVIQNGANTDLFKPMDTTRARGELGLNRSSNYVCFVGAFWKFEGVQYLIRSIPLILEQCPQARFLIVGDGIMKEEWIELTRQIGMLDKVIFTGMVPYQKVPLYINAGDLCVVPGGRQRNERIGASPLKLCEYMACGKPVIASRVDGLEIVEENNAGILVEPESPRSLATAIIKLIQNQELRKQMGERGRRYVLKNRSWASVARRVAEVFEQAIKEK